MNEDELYRALQRHLDRMPVPYPSTASGVEIRILKRLFTPDEARLALRLSAIPEPLETIHRRTRREMTREQLRDALERMAEKSAIQKLPGEKGPRYGKAPLVVGMYEGQVNRLTAELERDVRAYLEEALGKEMFGPRTPQMRTVPVHQSIPVGRAVASFDDIRRHVEAIPGPFAVIPCICRQGRALTGEPCRQTREPRNCLMLGVAAEMMTAKGIARAVSKEEMLGFLEQADREGLVLQPQNTVDPLFVCCCCGCCCGVLTTAKRLPRPADFFRANYYAEVNAPLCLACGDCVGRCQMEAIKLDEAAAFVDLSRCIGCGLCVTTCQTEAMSLVPRSKPLPPPRNTAALYAQIYRQRFGTPALIKAAAAALVHKQV